MKPRAALLAAISLLILALCVSSCTPTSAKPHTEKPTAVPPSNTWVIYVEGYGGTNQYEKQNKSRIVKLSVDGKRREVLGDYKGYVDDVTLSPNKNQLAFTAEGKLNVLDLTTRKIIASIPHKAKATFVDSIGEKARDYVCQCEFEEFTTPVWSPDGTKFAYITRHYGLGMNWGTLDIVDVKSVRITQEVLPGVSLFNAHLHAWLPGTATLVASLPEMPKPEARPQTISLLNYETQLTVDIAEKSSFVGLLNGDTVLFSTLVPLSGEDTATKNPLTPEVKLNFSAVQVQTDTPESAPIAGDFITYEGLSKLIQSPAQLIVTNDGSIIYTQVIRSNENDDYTRFLRVDPTLNKKTMIAQQKGYYARDLKASDDGRYVVFHRNPFLFELSGGPGRTTEFAILDTKRGSITVLAKVAGNYRQNPKATFPADAQATIYSEK